MEFLFYSMVNDPIPSFQVGQESWEHICGLKIFLLLFRVLAVTYAWHDDSNYLLQKGLDGFSSEIWTPECVWQVDQPKWQVHRSEKYLLLVSSWAYIRPFLEHIANNWCTWVLVLFGDGDLVDSVYFSGKKNLFASLYCGYSSRH